jgi:putative DNA primase/helicase
MLADTSRAVDALHAIPPTIDHDTRARVGMAAKDAGVTFADYDAWQSTNPRYNAIEVRSMWQSYDDGPVKAGTEPPRKPAPGMGAAAIWERCQPATYQHTYIAAKRAAGVPLDALRVVPAGDPLRIMGESMAGALVVPCMAMDGTLSTLQLIPPPDVAARLKAADKPGKLNLPGHLYKAGSPWANWCPVAWFTSWRVSGKHGPAGRRLGNAAVVCFGAGNMGKVAQALRQQDDAARLVLVPDVGKEDDAHKIAAAVGCMVAAMPTGEVNNFDANDLGQRDGLDVLALLLESATEPPVSYPVSVAFADELPERYDPPDELIEGLLTVGDGSVLYGDSNSGKTFLVIDMAASCGAWRALDG